MAYSYFVQSIDFYLKDGTVINSDLEVYAEDGSFGATATFPLVAGAFARSQTEMLPPVTTAVSAFDWLLDSAVTYAASIGTSIAKIDNPCNDPYIDKASQVAALSANGLSMVPVRVNGT